MTNSGFPAGTVAVSWGDGTPQEPGKPAAGELTHVYAANVEGTQTITITSEADATKTATTTFTPQPGAPGGTPTVTAAADPADTTGRTVQVTLAGFPTDSAVTVNWGDGTADTTVPAGTTQATHAYDAAATGEQTINATSATDPTKKATATFTPGGNNEPGQPTVSATPDPADATGFTVQVTLSRFPAASAVIVSWGDSTPDTTVPAGATQASHQYAQNVTSEQTITATAAKDSTVTATATFTPGGGPQPEQPTVTAEADASDATGRTVQVTLAVFVVSVVDVAVMVCSPVTSAA